MSKMRIIDECSLSDVKIYSVSEYQDLNENFDPKSFSPILGIVEGKSLVLDGVSRNGRFYPKELWQNALKREETKQLLKDKLMFGCIGHPENYTLDELLSDGKVSHIVSKIEIRKDGYGYATYEILDTEAGRILYTVLKAGSKMKVSTRGFGEFANESKSLDGKNYQVINPNTFSIESIDFVIHPGIADVDVKLMETLLQDNKDDLKKLKESKIQICEDGICTILEGIEVHEHYKNELSKYKKIVENLNEENQTLQDRLLEEVNDVSDDEDKKDDEEKDEFEEPLELLNAYLEHYLKQVHSVKAHSDRTDKLIEWINTPNDEFTKENFDDILELVKVFDDDYVEKVVKLVEWMKEKLFSEEEPDEELGVNSVDSKEIMDLIKDGNEKLVKEIEDKNSDEKSKAVKEAKEQTVKELTEDYNDLIRELTKKISIEQKVDEDFNALTKEIMKLKSDLVLSEKLLDDEKIKVESLNKSISESKGSVRKLEEEKSLLKEKNLFLEDEMKSKSFELSKQKELQKHLVNESVQERVQSTEQSFSEKLTKFKEEFSLEKETLTESYENEIKSLKEKLNTFEKEHKNLNENLEKEIIQEKSKVETLLQESNTQSNRLEELKKSTQILETENKSIKEENDKMKILYLQSLYKVDKTVIIETLNTFNDMEKVKESLEKKELKVTNFNEDFGLDLNIRQEKKKSVTLAEKLL